MRLKLFLSLVVLILADMPGQAGFVLLENFSGLALGSINGQHGWSSSGNDGLVTSDPVSSTNLVLAITNTSANTYHSLGSLSISNSKIGTLFFRMRWPGTTANVYSGLSDVAAPTASANYEANLRMETADFGKLKARDASTYDIVETLQKDAWYQVWIVIDNPRNLYSIYMQGGLFTNQVQLNGDSDGETWFSYRSVTTDAFNTNTTPQALILQTFLLKTASGNVGAFYVDDIFVDPMAANLASPLALPLDINPPIVLNVNPTAGLTFTSLTSVTVVFNESVANVMASDLRVNGIPATNVTGSGGTWTWQFPSPANGIASLSWASNTSIVDFANNPFIATNAWSYTIIPSDTLPPDLLMVSPAAGSVISNLSLVTVSFSEPVVGVNSNVLLLDDFPALSVTNSGNTFYFTFPSPPPGLVNLGFDPARPITDLAGNKFDVTTPGHSWTYIIADATQPVVTQISPAAGATVTRLDTAEILFSKPVTGIKGADLLINGTPATGVSGMGLGPYVFTFTQPVAGTVVFSWAAQNEITDLSPLANKLVCAPWTNTLIASGAGSQVIINEFLASNASSAGLRDEDGDLNGWIEMYNPGTTKVDLTGWSMTDDSGDLGKWTFPSVALLPGQFLVVYASGKDRRTVGGTNYLHTSFTLSPVGDYLALCPPDYPRVPTVEFASKYPGQRNDYSYGLDSSGNWRFFNVPTPGRTNGDSAITNSLGPVHMTVASGFFDAPFTLRLVPPAPGISVRYTTDGSLPTEVNGIDYRDPLVVSTTTILRAAAFQTNNLPSLPQTATYIFPQAVVAQPSDPSGFPITTLWNQYGWLSEYGMNPAVVNDPRYCSTLTNDLLAIPSLSIVMPVEDMFGAANGIYTHSQNMGPAWERACSVELINPDGTHGFQCDAGIQMHGGGSRARTQKHPFRVQFKGKYGSSKLQYQFFTDSPVTEFDGIDLRSDYNNHWNHGSDAVQRARGTLVRDAFCKDLQTSMSGLGGHTCFVHLYINGLYWGVYNPCERPDAAFGQAYLGGDKSEYDAYNGTGTQLVDGTADAHNAMLALTGLQNLPQYEQMKQYLDVQEYADYLILQMFAGNQDWGVSKNFYCLRRRVPGGQFKYLCWDGERAFETTNQLPLGVSTAANLNTVSPDNLQSKLVASSEYRLLFADRVQKHFFNNGALTLGNLTSTWQARASQIDRAIVGESARWGSTMTTDGQPGTIAINPLPYPGYSVRAPYVRDINWLGEQGRLLTNYFPVRGAIVLNQFRVAGLFPTNVMAPILSQAGGRVPSGTVLSLTATNKVYYTTDGTDPRVYGAGAVSQGALLYTNGITINSSAVIKARGMRDTNTWSPLGEASFSVNDIISPLRIVELMYNPIGGSSYEFLELLNTGSSTIDLSGYNFSGITYLFPAGSSIAGGSRLVLANNGNPAAWALRYPGISVAGWYGGNLNNSGERIALFAPDNSTVCSVTFAPSSGWPIQANGGGFSLEVINPQGNLNGPANWQPSNTPGQAPASLSSPRVLVNELMADNGCTVPNGQTCPDWVELFNPGTASVNLAGWGVGESSDPRKYVFPSSTSLAPGSYLVLWCDGVTNTTPGIHTGFNLSKDGDSVFLSDAQTNRIDAVSFGHQLTGYSLGRVDGGWTLTVPTPGATNLAASTVAQTNLVLNEWLANSSPGESDWLELHNKSTNLPVTLNGIYLTVTNQTFQLRSLSFIAPGGFVSLSADELPGPDHLDFKLPADGGIITLYDNTGMQVDRITFGAQVENVSQGRLPDGSTNLMAFPGAISPGTSNYVMAWSGPRLNEVLAINNGSVTNAAGNTADFVELFNPLTNVFNLTGYRLSVDSSAPNQWLFPSGTAISPNGYLVVWFDPNRPATTNSGSLMNSGHGIDRNSGAVYLFDSSGRVVDSVEFGFQIPDLPIGRCGGSWIILSAPTPEAVNAQPAALALPGGLRFNEWMVEPASGSDWIELVNTNPLPVDISGSYLTDDPSIAGRTKFRAAPLSFIAASGFVVWQADSHPSNGRNHTSFSLDKMGESLLLYNTNAFLIDAISFGFSQTAISEGRFRDGSSAIIQFAWPTPGASNTVLAAPGILEHPQSVIARAGTSAAFHVNTDTLGVSYQWSFNATNLLAGETNAALIIASVQPEREGVYSVTLSNSLGKVLSSNATLTVLVPPLLRMPNVLPNGTLRIILEGRPAKTYALDLSSNLLTWTEIGASVCSNGLPLQWDIIPTNIMPSFYRARALP